MKEGCLANCPYIKAARKNEAQETNAAIKAFGGKDDEIVEAIHEISNYHNNFINEAQINCKEGPKVVKKYGLFGRQVLRCGSKLRYARVFTQEL